MAFTKKIFIGGINQDDAEFLIDPKEYLGAMNIRFATNEKGEFGKITTVEGTTQKAVTIDNIGGDIPFVLPAGSNECVCAAEDSQNRRVIFINYNSQGNHAMYCYSADQDKVFTVLKGLSVQRDNYITGYAFIDNLFYWTDNVNEPSRVNVDSGIKTYHPTYSTTETPYTLPLSSSLFSVIRPQPSLPLTVSFQVTTGAPVEDSFQAAYRFITKDGEISAFSMLSTTYIGKGDKGNIRFSIPLQQKIPSDVTSIELGVKHLLGGKMFIYKTWNSNLSQHNSGTQLFYDFNPISVGVSVDDATTVKSFDSVPVQAKALDIVKNRLFMANTVSGRQSPAATSLKLTTTQAVVFNEAKVFKSGSTYKSGVVFYDFAGRPCGVVPGPQIDIPERKSFSGAWTNKIAWQLTGAGAEIPPYATHYSVVLTKGRKTGFFLQFWVNEIAYASKNSSNEYVFNLPWGPNSVGIAIKASSLYALGLGYQYQQGDVLNYYTVSGNIRLNVLDTYSDYVIVEYSPDVIANSLVEVYSPLAAGETDFYFEMGQKFAVSNPALTNRSYSTSSGEFNGDVYLKNRGAGVIVEVMNPNDRRWKEWYTDHGRPLTIVDKPIKRIQSAIHYSNVKSSGTNGLSTFDALDFALLPVEMGPAQKLVNSSKAQSEGSVLIAIGQNETASVYIGESQIFDSGGSSFLAKASGVIGQVNILKGSYGTLHPESVAKTMGSVYWFDASKGAVVRYDVNGLFPVSSYKMSTYFRSVAERILKDEASYKKSNVKPMRVLGAIDPYHGEYLIYIPRFSSIPTNQSLEDVEISSATYSFTAFPSCDLIITSSDPICGFTIISD
jgi:hypothetical protein